MPADGRTALPRRINNPFPKLDLSTWNLSASQSQALWAHYLKSLHDAGGMDRTCSRITCILKMQIVDHENAHSALGIPEWRWPVQFTLGMQPQHLLGIFWIDFLSDNEHQIVYSTQHDHLSHFGIYFDDFVIFNITVYFI